MADTNTIENIWTELFEHMQTLVGSGTPPFTNVVEGEATFDQEVAPFLTIQLLDAEPEQRTGNNKVWQCRIKIRIVEEFSSGTITATILNRVGDVENSIEAFTRPDGVAGFEDAKWSYTYPNDATHGNLIVAEAIRNFTVVVARGAN